MSRITKREFISEVSKRSKLRKDVVEDVFEAITDLMTEEIINKGEFVMKDLFSITNKSWKAYSPHPGIEIKSQNRLSVKLSEKLKKFWKMKNEHYPEVTNFSKDNLEKALKYHEEKKQKQGKPGMGLPIKRTNLSNPSSNSKNIIDSRLDFSKNSKITLKDSKNEHTSTQDRQNVLDDFNPLLDEDD